MQTVSHRIFSTDEYRSVKPWREQIVLNGGSKIKSPDWDHIGWVRILRSPYLPKWILWLLYSHIGSIVKPSFPTMLTLEGRFGLIRRDVWNLEVVCKSLWFPKNQGSNSYLISYGLTIRKNAEFWTVIGHD